MAQAWLAQFPSPLGGYFFLLNTTEKRSKIDEINRFLSPSGDYFFNSSKPRTGITSAMIGFRPHLGII